MKIEMRATPYFLVPLREEHVEALCELSAAHYDYRCRSASVPGPDGFINGWRNRIVYGDPGIAVEVSPEQLDLCFKTLEIRGAWFNAHPSRRTEREAAEEVYTIFHNCWLTLQSSRERREFDWVVRFESAPGDG